MDHILEILKIAGPLLLGGGASYIFFYRIKRKELENQVYVKQYKDVDDIMDDFIMRNANLTREISDLRTAAIQSDNILQQVRNALEINDCEKAKTILDTAYTKE